MGGGEAGDGHAERRARHVVEAGVVAEFDAATLGEPCCGERADASVVEGMEPVMVSPRPARRGRDAMP